MFVTEVADPFTSEVTIQFLRALQTEFGDYLHLILDNAMYFSSKRVAKFADESAIRVTYLPTGSPDINPVEECWRRFNRQPGNRYFESNEELRSTIRPALTSILPPIIYDFLCPSIETDLELSGKRSEISTHEVPVLPFTNLLVLFGSHVRRETGIAAK